ncbi:hypothetical protein [Paraflavitalea pollutisoli]|uniref:hypothetical protein n=1 Tax=Paraflavitalea pollutisoli TaxID=3034143 RepID=UPI0023ED794B|nr:hypothetical protein [Paraflavitalea sp. H1-2-19X]
MQPSTSFNVELVQIVLAALKGKRFILHDEKALQQEIHLVLLNHLPALSIHREYVLDEHSIIDFLIGGSLGIEVKIKGGKRDLYRQCERYCGFDQVKQLLLITNLSMGVPEQINNKDCYVYKLGTSWL